MAVTNTVSISASWERGNLQNWLHMFSFLLLVTWHTAFSKDPYS